MHLSYACRHSGACCTAGWPIPVEQSRIAPLRLLRPDGRWLVPAPDAPPDTAGLLANDGDGRCVFHRQPEARRNAGGCEIHRALGPSALPSACQHFPREILLDPRGAFVTLSHFCPTAAALLFEHAGPVTIVEGPPAIPAGDPEGLDARDVLPPLLRPGLLMDHAAYSLWEAHIVWCLTSSDRAPEEILAILDHHAHELCDWRPADGALSDAVTALGPCTDPAPQPSPAWQFERLLVACALDSLTTHKWQAYPDDAEQRWKQSIARGWSVHRHVIKRFLAAHAFAAWMAYQGDGVVTQITRLRLVLAVLRAEVIRECARNDAELNGDHLIEAIRRSDLLMVHLIDRMHLARNLGRGVTNSFIRVRGDDGAYV